MFLLRKSQQEIFSNHFLQLFEEDMMQHILTFFPNHLEVMKESAARQTIRHAYRRAGKYGFDSQRDVCLYLNTMLCFGSDFDTDPQYPWARSILAKGAGKAPSIHIDELADMAESVDYAIMGPGRDHIRTAFQNFRESQSFLFTHQYDQYFGGVTIDFLSLIFPEKTSFVGASQLGRLIELANDKAAHYGITERSHVPVYAALALFFGCGFDEDPQFPWSQRILGHPWDPSDKKIRMLYTTAIDNLDMLVRS